MSDDEVAVSDAGEDTEETAVEEAEEEQLGEEEQIPENPLNEEIMAECLSLLCKTGDGLAHAYVRLDIHEREVTDVKLLEKFIHLRYIDLSKNLIKDITPLNSLSQILHLKAEGNLLTTGALDPQPYLQVASFSGNKLTSLEGINHPLLEQLNLNSNLIASVQGLEPGMMQRLHTLELRGNKLTSLAGLDLANLKNLFLAQNLITSLVGIDKLVQLTTLHMRENQLENLDGFSEANAKLQYINMRGNNINNIKELHKLKCLPLLRAISLAENPCSEEDDYRQEVLIAVRRLERLDKDEFTDEERAEAEEISEQRKEEEARAKTEELENTIAEGEPEEMEE